MVEHNEEGPVIGQIVRHFVGAGREDDRVELAAREIEELVDALAKVAAQFARIHVLHKSGDDLVQVRFDHEAERRPRTVVDVEGFGNELEASLLDEGGFQGRKTDAETQLFRRDAAGGVAIGERVPEDGPGQVRRGGRQAGEHPLVDALSERWRVVGDCGDVSLDRAGVLSLAHLGVDLGADGLKRRVHVVDVDGVSVGRLFPPEEMDSAGQQTEHAAGALKSGQRSRLFGEHLEELRMERIGAAELVLQIGTDRFGRQGVAAVRPDLRVGCDHFCPDLAIDAFKETDAEDIGGLVFFSGVQRRAGAGGDAFSFSHGGGGSLVFFLVGIPRPVVLADGERIDQRYLRR